jgi:hypothetical protein
MLFHWISMVLCWEAHICTIGNLFFIVMRIGVEYIVRAHTKKMNFSLINAVQMKRLVNASKNFFLLMIKPKEDIETEAFQGCDTKLKSNLYEVVTQYDEMFKEPKGLPPKRGVQHEIQLQQDSPLPNIGMYRMSVMENAEIKKQI